MLKIKSFLITLLERLISSLKQVEAHQTKASQGDEKSEDLFFEDLTAKVEAESTKNYCQAIHWALKRDNVLNIALSGPYGSGKSTILNTLRHQDKKHKFLHISLASFSDPNPQKLAEAPPLIGPQPVPPSAKEIHEEEQLLEERHKLIELSILQQMLYTEPGNKLPYSRFKRIVKLSTSVNAIKSLLLILFIVSGFFLYNKSIREHLYHWKSMTFTLEACLLLLNLVIFILGAFWLSMSLLRFLYTSKFSKINLSSGEIEISKDVESSILNKYLDEILYFFESTRYNVVILEDLDRFNDPEIFTKLREINMLINNSKQIRPRKVRFIYAIKDDMFAGKNRAKFFDFIIPVIPHLSAANSLDVILPRISGLEPKPAISTRFLYGITLFVDDMRVMTNVINEFVLYKRNLEDSSFQDETLLGFMVYKNLFPSDFAKIYNREGDIAVTFEQKIDYVTSYTKDLLERIKTKEKILEGVDAEKLGSVVELRSVFIQALHRLLPEAVGIELSGRRNFAQLQDPEVFEHLSRTSNIVYYSRSGSEGRTTSNISFLDLEKEAGNRNYQRRKTDIEAGSAEEKQKTENELASLRYELKRLNNAPLKTLLKQNREVYTAFPALVKKPLLRYLISEGYIDEMYETQVSHFYSESLTSNDLLYLKRLRTLEKPMFQHLIGKPEALLHRMSESDFLLHEALNFRLLSFLLENADEYPAECDNIFTLLADESKESQDFIVEYLLDQVINVEPFVARITQAFPKFWLLVYHSPILDVQLKSDIMQAMILTCKLEVIDKQNVNKSLRYYLEESGDFLLRFKDKKEHRILMNVVRLVDAHFTNLSPAAFESPVFAEIYQQQYFTISKEMFHLMFRYATEKQYGNIPEFWSANLTTIRKYNCSPLLTHIDNYLDLYIEHVDANLPENTNESVEVIRYLLAKLSKEENKIKVISKQQTRLPDFQEVDQTLWAQLLVHNKIEAEWSNLIAYFQNEKDFGPNLVRYINEQRNYFNLSTRPVSIIPASQNYPFFIAMFSAGGISLEALSLIIKMSKPSFAADTNFGDFSPETIRLFVDSGSITLNTRNFEVLYAVDEDLRIYLVKRNINAFFKNIGLYQLSALEWIKLINSGITEKQKIRIVELIQIEAVSAVPIAAHLISIMLKHQFAEARYELIRSILRLSQNMANKVKVLNLYALKYNKEQLRGLLQATGGKYEEIKPGFFPRLAVNAENGMLLELLKQKGIVKDFPEIKNKNKYRVLPAR